MPPPVTPPLFYEKKVQIAKKGYQAWGFDHFGHFFCIPPLFMPFFIKLAMKTAIFGTFSLSTSVQSSRGRQCHCMYDEFRRRMAYYLYTQ